MSDENGNNSSSQQQLTIAAHKGSATVVIPKNNPVADSMMNTARIVVIENNSLNLADNMKKLLVDMDKRFNELSEKLTEVDAKFALYVTIERFKPVELIAYGFASGIGAVVVPIVLSRFIG